MFRFEYKQIKKTVQDAKVSSVSLLRYNKVDQTHITILVNIVTDRAVLY